jgi:hypothetical protein
MGLYFLLICLGLTYHQNGRQQPESPCTRRPTDSLPKRPTHPNMSSEGTRTTTVSWASSTFAKAPMLPSGLALVFGEGEVGHSQGAPHV